LKKNIRIFTIVFPVLSCLILGSCSSHKNPVTEVKNTPPSETEVFPSSEEMTPEESLSSDEIIETQAGTHQTQQEEIESKEDKDPSRLLEKAMSVYQEAQIAWDQGDLDNAIASLDEAYKLIVKLELPQDSPWIQEKNDLRLLIAQRIQEIYASRTTAIGENHGTIPLVENKHVLREIQSFQGVERKAFEDAYRRSGRYRKMIQTELRKEGLPEELSWMPIIESGFKVRAYSRARALGLWQFISSTGYRFGLKRDRWIDERMDPEKSTRAAVAYLKELHSFFGDWTTALAGYNCGEFRVQRVIKAQRINYLDDFWDLYVMLPRETARFTPRFIATLMIISNPEKYGMNLPVPDPPLEYDTITINRPIKLASLSQQLGLPAEKLADMNPELRHKSTPDQEYNLKVPAGTSEQALSAANSLSRWIPPEATYVIHYVRRGETVSGIANRYRTSVSAIARLNQLGRKYLIRPGQRLKVPSRGGASYSPSQSLNLDKEGEKLVYTVKRGDSLYLIANAFNTNIQKIKSQNGLKSNLLRVGQKLTIYAGTPEGAVMYTVKSGDTPFKIAQRHGMNLSVLLQMNGLTIRSTIYPGQKLWITSK
jgi:membrane-bound lytic murein transglycosylase D